MNILFDTLVPAIGWSLLHFVWQGLLIGWGAALVLHLLRNARPQARYAVACAALLLCAALPVGGIAWRVQEALQAADAATRLPCDDAVTCDTLGVVYGRANLHAQAAEAFRRAVRLAPRRARTGRRWQPARWVRPGHWGRGGPAAPRRWWPGPGR